MEDGRLQDARERFQRAIETRDRTMAEGLLHADYALVLMQPAKAVMPRARWLEVLPDYIVHDYAVEDEVADVDERPGGGSAPGRNAGNRSRRGSQWDVYHHRRVAPRKRRLARVAPPLDAAGGGKMARGVLSHCSGNRPRMEVTVSAPSISENIYPSAMLGAGPASTKRHNRTRANAALERTPIAMSVS